MQDNNDELYERFSITVDKGQEPLRIDKFLMNRIEGATRNKLQQAINTGHGAGEWQRNPVRIIK